MRKRIVAAIVVAMTLIPSLAAYAATSTVGGFEIDGNFTYPDNPSNGGTRDWETVGGVVRVNDPSDTQADDAFKGGSKEQDPDGWQFVQQKSPGKDDLTRIYAANEVTQSHAYLWLAFERLGVSGSGDAHVDFELNQKSSTIVNSQNETIPERSNGDLLVVYDYAGGTGPVTISVFRWNGNATAGSWDLASPPPNTAEGEVNRVAITRPDLPGNDPFGGGTVDERRFGEAGIDYTAIFGNGALTCPGFSSVWAKTRSSGESIDSSLQDKVGPVPIDFSTCGSIKVLKKDDSGQPLDGAVFELWKDNGDGVFTASDTNTGKTCTTGEEGTAGQCTFETVDPGTYFVLEKTAPSGYALDPTVSKVVVGFREDVTVSHTYVDPKIQYRITITPATDTNLVGNDHVFTVHLEKSLDSGQTWVDAPGEVVGLSLSGPGSITGTNPAGPNASSCTTNASGTCTVTIHSNSAGLSTLTATFNKQTATTPVNVSEQATKQWVNYRISITPEATNLVGTTHTFTVVLEKTLNGTTWTAVSGATIDVSKTAGPGSITGGTCVSGTTNASGACTVTITSSTPGDTTIKASYDAVESDTTATFSASAVKHWVDYRVLVVPNGTNLVGQPHTFTVTVQRDTGSGWTNLSGQSVSLAWSGVAGSVITSIPGGTVAGDGQSGSCTTGAGGTCTVTVNSSAAGSGTLTATFSTVLDSGPATFNASATKTWLNFRITVTPQQDTNLLPEEPTHTFLVTVETTSNGTTWTPVNGGTVDLALASTVAKITSSNGAIAQDGLSGDCTTDANGQCTVVITTTGPGTATLTASYKATVGEATLTITDSGAKTWITYRVTVTPESATNLVGSDHTFTVTIESTTDGTTWDPVSGVNPDIEWTGVGSIVGGTCSTTGTDNAGKCTVVVHSNSTGVGTLTAKYLAVVGQASHTFSDEGTKTWIDYKVQVTPLEAANLVGTNHVFTVTVFKDSGDGKGFQPLAGAKPTIALSGPGTIVTNTCADPGTDSNGECTVTVTSATPGLTTIKATYLGSADNGSAEFVAQATKQWVDYRIDVNPPTAINPVGTTHTFTVTLQVDTGEGFGPAAEATVNLTLSGPGTIIDIPGGTIAADGRSGTCVTDQAGQCKVTITSDVPGLSTLEASYHAVVGETSRTFTDEGQKRWVPTVKTFTLTVNNTGDEPDGVTYWARYSSVPAGTSGTVALTCVETAPGTLTCKGQVELAAGTYNMEVFAKLADGKEISIKEFPNEKISGAQVDNVAAFTWPKPLKIPKTGASVPATSGLGFGLVGIGTVLRYAGRRRRTA